MKANPLFYFSDILFFIPLEAWMKCSNARLKWNVQAPVWTFFVSSYWLNRDRLDQTEINYISIQSNSKISYTFTTQRISFLVQYCCSYIVNAFLHLLQLSLSHFGDRLMYNKVISKAFYISIITLHWYNNKHFVSAI